MTILPPGFENFTALLIKLVISNKNNLSDYKETNISYDYNKINNISNTISYFSLFMWILTSIVALKF